MCGINGIYGVENSKAKQMVSAMNNCLKHRGPDDEGIYIQENIALGHRRLSIIDLSEAGHQPMTIENGSYTIVYNGELYNYQELKKELTSVQFKTNTDTEVILQAYKVWGTNCLQKFNGMYAFAIYDTAEKSLFIARDRLGIKPLYFYKEENAIAFSSELRALLSTGLMPKKLDKNALIDYLRYQTVHAPYTLIQGINMLAPGTFMLCKSIGNKSLNIQTQKYWDLKPLENYDFSSLTYNKTKENIFDLLFKAVERRLVADVPFGAFLSGGIDSSAVVALMSKASDVSIKTFCVSFKEEEFSESKYAEIISKKYKTDHHNIVLSVEDFKNELPNALAAMDFPSGDGPNTYIVSKATKEAGITMALSGLGGDEVFAGYDVFTRTNSLFQKNWISSFPKILRTFGVEVYKNIKPSVAANKLALLINQQNLLPATTYPVSRLLFSDKELIKLLSDTNLPANRVKQIVSLLDSSFNYKTNLLSWVSAAEISTYLQNVLLRDTDQMSMAHALEVRVPFMDYQLIEFTLGVSDVLKYPHTPKKLLVDSLGDLLPPEIVNRKKMGFTLPWDIWMRKDLNSFCEEKIMNLQQRGLFKEDTLINLWKTFINGSPGLRWSHFWYLIVLEDWLEKNNVSA